MATAMALTLHGRAMGVNPWKVAIILEELGVSYKHKLWAFPDLKKEPFESLNPNGRVPALEDPNTGVTIFESGAIIDYLLDTYDKSNKLSPGIDKPSQKYAMRSWRDFQMSGQGPYFGQGVWFTKYHPEKLESARERYRKEARRIVGVIDRHLNKQKTEYLTGSVASYADLMFVPWNIALEMLLPEGTDLATEFPNFNSWWQKILARPMVAKVLAEREKAIASL
ncbi:hypothetical protein NQ176_g6527 [Zarea fungicola]|uniref:Uncharacterized protein n=1 Tax=Zarea fungicola TaxID=93591 RepID=A0ACC1N3T9_9HYPO|nr:hypothetical protein NQ176_g6527 [Lecanicillium fungicola]